MQKNDDVSETRRYPLPHWVTPILLAVAFLAFHVVLPWALSLLSTRYGWWDGLPGVWNWLGLLLAVVGIAVTVRLIFQHYQASPGTFVEFKQSEKLITPGLYGISRNPMYLFELTFWLGWAIFYGSLPVLAAFVVWLVIMNFLVVPYEERDLERRFGEPYRQYKARVPRWINFKKRD
jgi:protein-S-isoprenylcysteine O-methyltransferase Ste14